MEFICAELEKNEKQTQVARMRKRLRDWSNPLEMERILDGKLRRTSIPNIVKLAATLRFCAQGSYQLGVGNESQVAMAQSTTSKVLKEVFSVLERNLCHQWIKFDYTDDEIAEAKLAFYVRSGFPGAVGCIDGTHIKIVAPRKELQHLYYNRKGFYSLNAMVVCDHKMRIRYLNAKHPGASHDSAVFRLSMLSEILENERRFWLLGDAGYALKPYLMTPYRSAEEGTSECTYNKRHASARSIVERAIGVLKNRFRCLLGARALHYRPEKATQIVNVCAALHNICIHYKIDDPEFEDVELLDGMEDDQQAEGQPVENEGQNIRRRIMLSFNNL